MEYNSIFLHLRRLLKFNEPSSVVGRTSLGTKIHSSTKSSADSKDVANETVKSTSPSKLRKSSGIVVGHSSSEIENNSLPTKSPVVFKSIIEDIVQIKSPETENFSYENSLPIKLSLTSFCINKLVQFFLVFTMIVFRHFLSMYLIHYMWKQRGVIVGPPFWIGMASTLVFIPINIGMSYRIYVSDYRKLSDGKTRKQFGNLKKKNEWKERMNSEKNDKNDLENNYLYKFWKEN